MAEVMKIMVTSFKRCHASTATLSEPNLAADHHQSMPLPETPRHSWASPGQSLAGSLVACCRVGGMDYSSTCMGSFEGGHHYLHYLHPK